MNFISWAFIHKTYIGKCIHYQLISCHWSLSIPPENIRKSLVFWCLQEVEKQTSGMNCVIEACIIGSVAYSTKIFFCKHERYSFYAVIQNWSVFKYTPKWHYTWNSNLDVKFTLKFRTPFLTEHLRWLLRFTDSQTINIL